jgi:hypothetical protein
MYEQLLFPNICKEFRLLFKALFQLHHMILIYNTSVTRVHVMNRAVS